MCLIVEILPPKKDPGVEGVVDVTAAAADDADANRSEAESCRRVLTTQIGLVAVLVAIPAMAAAQRCT